MDIGITSLNPCGESALSSCFSSGTWAGKLYGPSSAGNGAVERIGEGKCFGGAGEGALDTFSGPEELELRELGRLGLIEGGRWELGDPGRNGIWGCGKGELCTSPWFETGKSMADALEFERRERMLVLSEMIEMRLLSGILATAWDDREDAFCPYAYGRRYPG